MCKQSASKGIINYFILIVFFILQFPISANAQRLENRILKEVTTLDYPIFSWENNIKSVLSRSTDFPPLATIDDETEIMLAFQLCESFVKESVIFKFKKDSLSSIMYICFHCAKNKYDILNILEIYLGDPIYSDNQSFEWDMLTSNVHFVETEPNVFAIIFKNKYK